jgi:hypothetical protein
VQNFILNEKSLSFGIAYLLACLAPAADPSLSTAGDGFGFNAVGLVIYATKHESSTSQTLSAGSLGANGPVFLLAGKINWEPNGTADEFFLFNISPVSQTFGGRTGRTVRVMGGRAKRRAYEIPGFSAVDSCRVSGAERS